jgi:hypothetical protein
MPQIRSLFTCGPDIPIDNGGSDLLHRGMLTQAVGGAFNMMFPAQRLAAFMWMYNTIRDWENLERSQRSAVFDMGPGGDEVMRDSVAELMDHMRMKGWFEIFMFTPMQNAGVLVTVGPSRPVRE